MTGKLRSQFILVVIGLFPLLGGCVISEKPLFDVKTAVTPASPGLYAASGKPDNWASTYAGRGELTLTDKTYTFKRSSDGVQKKFILFDSGSNLLISQSDFTASIFDRKRSTQYAVFKRDEKEFLYYEVSCSNLKSLALPRDVRPTLTSEGNCVYNQRKKLIAALRIYTRHFQPTARIKLVDSK